MDKIIKTVIDYEGTPAGVPINMTAVLGVL